MHLLYAQLVLTVVAHSRSFAYFVPCSSPVSRVLSSSGWTKTDERLLQPARDEVLSLSEVCPWSVLKMLFDRPALRCVFLLHICQKVARASQ